MSEDRTGNPSRPPGATGSLAGGRVQGFSPLPTGTRIGELVIQSVLGAGEFGITYVTEHEKRSKRYVLKEYFPRAIARREGLAVRPREQAEAAYAWGLERFLSEARQLQEVKHPSVVAVLGVTQHGGTGYVGMAYEAGVDFSIWLHERKRIAPQEDLDAILAPLLDGLAQAHAAKVFHFDMTPDSIILRDNGTPVLVDFGVFRVGLRRRLPPGNLRELVYAAPELLATAGGPIGPWTDIYSLAGLLYLAVTGRSPVSCVERSTGTGMPSAASAAKGKYRAEFLAAIDAGLRLHPAQRPRSVPDFSRALLHQKGSLFSLSRLLPSRSIAQPAPPSAASNATKPAGARDEREAVSLGGTPVTGSPGMQPKPPERAALVRGGGGSHRMLFAALGFVGGALVGTLLAVIVAGLLRQDCGAESCAAPFLLPFGAIGALIGAWEGYRTAARALGRSSQIEI